MVDSKAEPSWGFFFLIEDEFLIDPFSCLISFANISQIHFGIGHGSFVRRVRSLYKYFEALECPLYRLCGSVRVDSPLVVRFMFKIWRDSESIYCVLFFIVSETKVMTGRWKIYIHTYIAYICNAVVIRMG